MPQSHEEKHYENFHSGHVLDGSLKPKLQYSNKMAFRSSQSGPSKSDSEKRKTIELHIVNIV